MDTEKERDDHEKRRKKTKKERKIYFRFCFIVRSEEKSF